MSNGKINIFKDLGSLKINPLYLYLFMLAFVFGLLNVLQSISQIELYHIKKFSLGLDFRVFYKAAIAAWNGMDIYSTEGFVTPPLSAYIFIPLTIFELNTARNIFLILNLGTVFFALLISFKCYFNFKESKLYIGVTFISLFFTFPFLFLFDRANIDGIVWLLMISSIFFSIKKEKVSAILLSLAVLIKIYPILLLIPFIIYKKKSYIIYFLSTSFLVAILFFQSTLRFFSSIMINRISKFKLEENISLYNLSDTLRIFIESALGFQLPNMISQFFNFLPIIVFLIFIIILILKDINDSTLSRYIDIKTVSLMYFPLLFFIPKLAYSYEAVALYSIIPMFIILYKSDSGLNNTYVHFLFAILLLIIQFPIVSYQRVFDQLLLKIGWDIDLKYIFILPSLSNLLLAIFLIKIKNNYPHKILKQ